MERVQLVYELLDVTCTWMNMYNFNNCSNDDVLRDGQSAFIRTFWLRLLPQSVEKLNWASALDTRIKQNRNATASKLTDALRNLKGKRLL